MTVSRAVLLVGVIMIIVGAFGVGPSYTSMLGIGVAFAAGLVP